MPGSSAGAERPPALVITGPTASGKSALALALAEQLRHDGGAEIVSMDSAQVYRGLDIGTAKPNAAEREAVPHHLIDILDPAEAYSAARFVADARRLIGEIATRGRTALVVGGTPMYLHALQHGLDPLPAADPALRAEIEAAAAARGWPALHAELMQLDPATAARLAPGDAQRIQRALEVVRLSGRPLAELQRGPRPPRADALPVLSLEPQERAWLHARIARRFEQMLDAGLLDEVRALRTRPDLHAGLPALRCVGYRQAWAALDEDGDPAKIQATLRERGIAATRQMAKRQLTWLRGMARDSVACDAPDAIAQALAAAHRMLKAPPVTHAH